MLSVLDFGVHLQCYRCDSCYLFHGKGSPGVPSRKGNMGLKLSGINLPSLEYRHVIPQHGDTTSINPVQLLRRFASLTVDRKYVCCIPEGCFWIESAEARALGKMKWEAVTEYEVERCPGWGWVKCLLVKEEQGGISQGSEFRMSEELWLPAQGSFLRAHCCLQQ